MSRIALVFILIASNLLVGCNEPITCGNFDWDESRMRCVCRSDTVTQEDGSCLLPDGGVAFPPGHDASARDAQIISDGGADASIPDACVEISYFRDGDEDGFGDPGSSVTICESAPAGYVSNAEDCDDDCLDCRPGSAESCNGRDDDCNGITDGDDLCEFGNGCIDAECVPIPIYQWHAHVAPDTRVASAVRDIRVEGDTRGGTYALITYTGAITINATTLAYPASTTSVSLVRFASDGSLVDQRRIASAGSASRLRVTGFAVDATGGAYVAAEFLERVAALETNLNVSGAGSFVAYQPMSGSGWVRRYGSFLISALTARADGFVTCGTFIGPTMIGDAMIDSDASGDTLFLWGSPGGEVTRTSVMTSVGSATCADLASRGPSTLAVGSYRGDAATIGSHTFDVPLATDVWALEMDDDGVVAWTGTGGSESDDYGAAAVASETGNFIASSTGFEPRFGAMPTFDSAAIVLVGYDSAGSPSPMYSPATDADDDQPAATVMAACHLQTGAPVIAASVRWSLSATRIEFGPMRFEDRGYSEGLLFGYSADGSRASWAHRIGGPEAEDVTSVAATSPSMIVVGGLFDTLVELSPVITVPATTIGQDGYIVAYRVR